MSGRRDPSVEIEAPAKVNLGLEVIGRRDDGFHEIATIFLAIDRFDHLRLTLSDELNLNCDDASLAGETNLVLRALHALRNETGFRGGARLDLAKRIPTAAGLGGASSDAAAALLGACDLWRLDISDWALHDTASRLGSDVPFFLRGGCALGRGRGEVLVPLPFPRDAWFTVVVPDIVIPNKTASLYARLGRGDFSDGSRVAAQGARLGEHLPLDQALLGNAFAGPLYALAPELRYLPRVMREVGATSVAVSGAGPAHYTAVADPGQAELIATRLRERLGDRAQIFVARPAPRRPARSGPL